jgi:hypothetical protein
MRGYLKGDFLIWPMRALLGPISCGKIVSKQKTKVLRKFFFESSKVATIFTFSII